MLGRKADKTGIRPISKTVTERLSSFADEHGYIGIFSVKKVAPLVLFFCHFPFFAAIIGIKLCIFFFFSGYRK